MSERSLCRSRSVVAAVASVAIAVVGTAVGAQGQEVLLLHDSFTAPRDIEGNVQNTFDLNAAPDRQSGPLAFSTYTQSAVSGGYGHQLGHPNAIDQLLLADGLPGVVSLDRNFNGALSAGGLRIAFDADANPDNESPNGGDLSPQWTGLALGLDQPSQLSELFTAGTKFGIIFRDNGNIQAFDSGTNVTPVEVPYTLSPGGTHHFELLLSDPGGDGNPFDGVGGTRVEVFVDGGIPPVYTYTKGGGGFADNYVNFEGSFRSHMDDLRITQVPEPSAAAAAVLAVAGLAGGPRRRRRV